MGFRDAAHRSFVVILILLLSVLCGFAYQKAGHALDIKKHPREYTEYVGKYCDEYGVPEYIVYSVILNGSGFQSNFVSEDGSRIGLMQLTDYDLRYYSSLTQENLSSGILYDPETNVRIGTYLMSYYYNEYGRWNTVYAIFASDQLTVLGWMADKENTDEFGNLSVIPDEDVSNYVNAIAKEADTYRDLYYINEQ